MLRKLAFALGMSCLLALPSGASEPGGAVSGYVRNSAGAPQMGALVELIGSASHVLKLFTDEHGFYSAKGLLPGTYSLQVYATSYLPTLKEKIGLKPGSSLALNVTVSSLFDAVQLKSPGRSIEDEEDWKWVLRSTSNRPVLRFQNVGIKASASHSPFAFHDVTGTFSVLAGSPADGYGSSSDMSTGFSVEAPVANGKASFSGNVGYGDTIPATVLRAAYRGESTGPSGPEIALTMRNIASPDLNLQNSDFQSFAVTTTDHVQLGVLELDFGSEAETIQFLGRVSALRPFGKASYHVSPDTVLGYQYETSEPANEIDRETNDGMPSLADSGPRMSISGYKATLERAHHQEFSATHRMGRASLQVAAYLDRISDPALTGIGEYTAVNGEVLPDVYSGTFTYRGGKLDTNGVRVEFAEKINSKLTATVDFAYGGALELASQGVLLGDVRESSVVRQQHAFAGKLKGTVPGTRTRWIASYRWTDGPVLTPVDMFNSASGESAPYLNLYFRQPIPGGSFLPNHLEAMIDLRNLLAQGYVPVQGEDGHTVYLVQAAKSVSGGLAFTF
jgi:hypothetical protein